ncbi:MAG: LmeA family phospholipid-binding protein [Bacillota bacterium]
MRKVLTWLLNLFIFIALAQLILPPVAAAAIRQVVLQEYHPVSASARVEAFPALKLLLGMTDRLWLEMGQTNINGVAVARISTQMEGVKVDLLRFLKNRDIELSNRGNSQIEIFLSEQDLLTYLNGKIPGLEQPRLSISPEGMVLTGNVMLLGNTMEMQLLGKLVVIGENRLSFKPDNLRIDGWDPGPVFRQRVLDQTHLEFGIGPLPWGMILTSVDLAPGGIMLKGR